METSSLIHVVVVVVVVVGVRATFRPELSQPLRFYLMFECSLAGIAKQHTTLRTYENLRRL